MGETLEERPNRQPSCEPLPERRGILLQETPLIDVARRFEREACRANTLRVI
jgi:hypothetical protein